MQVPNIQQPTVFNAAQLDLLEMMSHVKSDESLKELRQVVAKYFADKIEKEIDEMWDDGLLSEEKVEGFRNMNNHANAKDGTLRN